MKTCDISLLPLKGNRTTIKVVTDSLSFTFIVDKKITGDYHDEVLRTIPKESKFAWREIVESNPVIGLGMLTINGDEVDHNVFQMVLLEQAILHYEDELNKIRK